MSYIKKLADKIMEDGVITKEEQTTFREAVMEDGKVSEEEKEQLNIILRSIDEGKIKLL